MCKLPEQVDKQCSSATRAEDLRVLIIIHNDYMQVFTRESNNCQKMRCTAFRILIFLAQIPCMLRSVGMQCLSCERKKCCT